MGFCSTTSEPKTASGKTPSCPQKSASGKFFASNRKRTYQIERNPLKVQQEKRQTPTKTASGVFFYKYRHYDPALGRWPSRDPIGENGGVNLYAFVGNEPIGRWDYLGLQDGCTARVHFGHFTSNDVTGGFGIDDDYTSDFFDHFDSNPFNNPFPTCYVGCGVGPLNEGANDAGFGIPNSPTNSWPNVPWPDGISPNAPNGPAFPAIPDNNDYLPEDEVEERLDQAIEAAVNAICNRGVCCKVTIIITCNPNDDGGKLEQPDRCGKTITRSCME